MKKEIYKNGPIACGVYSTAIHKYDGSILDVPDAEKYHTHVISIVGWDFDEKLNK